MALFSEYMNIATGSLSKADRSAILCNQHEVYFGQNEPATKEIRRSSYWKSLAPPSLQQCHRWLDEQYFDEFMHHGKLRLASVHSYSQGSNPYSTDGYEGMFILNEIFEDFERFSVSKLGESSVILCASISLKANHGKKQFGFTITDNSRFCLRLAHLINELGYLVSQSCHGLVRYQYSRVIGGEISAKMPTDISVPALDSGGVRKYFCKHKTLSHEKEYRFGFMLDKPVEYIYIQDKALIELVRPIRLR